MSGHCDNAENCKETGEYLCNCKDSQHHPGTCCMKSCPLAFLHGVGCCAILTSDMPHEIAVAKNQLDPDWDGVDPFHCKGEPNCCGLVYHTVVCSLCLPLMVLALLGGSVCWCIGCWNGCCGCDDKCKKSSAVGPVVDQPGGSLGDQQGGAWPGDESGSWDSD